MFKYIKQFFLFLLPILSKALLQVAADTLTKMAYPDKLLQDNKPQGHRLSRRQATVNVGRAVREANEIREGFHDVLLVAFDITGPDSMLAQEWLMDNMPKVGQGGDTDEINLDSWWIADDNRLTARGDYDSAVFVTKGNQAEARELLREFGLAL